ncbi:hypothetical protein ACLB1M_23980 [Escherichia coli]
MPTLRSAAFGALGAPILVAGQVTESIRSTLAQWRDVSYRSCRSLCRLLVATTDGWKGVKDAASGAGSLASFAVTQLLYL